MSSLRFKKRTSNRHKQSNPPIPKLNKIGGRFMRYIQTVSDVAWKQSFITNQHASSLESLNVVWHKVLEWMSTEYVNVSDTRYNSHSTHSSVYIWYILIANRHACSRDCHITFGDCAVGFNTLRTGSFKLFKRPFAGFLTILTLLNAELNPICYLLALLAHHFLHVSRIRVKSLTLRLLMSHIYMTLVA